MTCHEDDCENAVDCALESGEKLWIPFASCPGTKQCCIDFATCGEPLVNDGECRALCGTNESLAKDGSFCSPGYVCCVDSKK